MILLTIVFAVAANDQEKTPNKPKMLRIVFDTALDPANNVDQIFGFETGRDKIVLDNAFVPDDALLPNVSGLAGPFGCGPIADRHGIVSRDRAAGWPALTPVCPRSCAHALRRTA